MIEGLKFDVSLNSKNFEAGIKSMSNSLKGLESGLNRLKNTVLGLVSAWASFTTIKKSINLFAQQEQATLKLAFATQRFTKNAKQTFDTINQLADSMQETIGVGNEYVQNLAAIGLSYGIFEEKINQATEASVLLSKVIGTDAQTIMRGFAQTLQGQLGILGRYIPELRNLNEEQLRSGAAIDYVFNKFSGLKDVLGGTTQANLDKIKSYLGDIGEYLGAIFAPAVKRTADIVKWFATALADPQQAIETIKQKIIDFYNSLSPIGKAVLSVAGAFLGFQIAVGAWNLLVRAIGLGGAAIVKTFQTIFSWPFLLAFGASVIYAAWHDNWFGIRDLINNVWQKIEPIFMAMWSWITKGWNWTVNIVGEGWQWIENVALPLVGQAFFTVWNWLVDIGSEAISFITNKVFPLVGKAVSTTWSWSANFVGDAWDFLRDKAFPWIGRTVSTIWGWIVQMLGAGWQTLKNLLSWIGSSVGTVWDWILNVSDNIGKGFVWFWDNILKPLIGGAWGVLKTSWDFLVNLSTNLVKGFVWLYDNILSPLAEGTWNVLKTSWDIVVSIATDIGKGFMWFYDNILKRYVGEALETTWSITVEHAGNIDEIFNQIKTDIENKDWKSIGINIVKFIAEGFAWGFDLAGVLAQSIANMFSEMRGGLGGAKQALKDYIKQTLIESSQEAGAGVDWTNIFEGVRQFAQQAGFSEVVSVMMTSGLAIGEALKEGVLLAFDLGEIIGLAVAAVGVKFYKSVIEPVGKKMGEALGDGFKAMLDFGKWVIEKVAETLSNFYEAGKTIATNIVDGIVDFFNSINPFTILLDKLKLMPAPQIEIPIITPFGYETIKPSGSNPGQKSGAGGGAWQAGGYTPDVGIDQIAGVVHGGEWVAPAWMVRKYKTFFDWLEMIRQRGYQSGGYVGSNMQIGSKEWFDLSLNDKLRTMLDSYVRVWGGTFDTLIGYLKNLTQKMGIQLPQEVSDAINSLSSLETEFGKLSGVLDESKTNLSELSNTMEDSTKKISQSTQAANSALQAFASHIEWLSYSNGGLKLDLGAGIGNFINILLGGVPQIFPVLNWVFNPFSALANFILDMLRPKPKEPEFTQEEPTTYGQTFVAGTPKEVVYNFNVVFKENVLLTEDENAQKTLFEAFVRYVQEHGGVEVVFG